MFKVYNGPAPLPKCLAIKFSGRVNGPITRSPCENEICVWLSTEYCYEHALLTVMEHDLKHARQRLIDFSNGEELT